MKHQQNINDNYWQIATINKNIMNKQQQTIIVNKTKKNKNNEQ